MQDNYYLQSKLDEEYSSPSPNESNLKKIHYRLNTNETKLNNIKSSISKTKAEYPWGEVWSKTTQIAEIKKFSKQANTAIIEYFWGDSTIYILGTNRDKCHFLKINQSDDLKSHIRHFKRCLTKGYVVSSKQQDFKDFTTSSSYIYNSIVKPMEEILALKSNLTDEPGSRVVFIPDGDLLLIPFEALLTAKPNKPLLVDYRTLAYFILKYPISYGYSTRFVMAGQVRKKISSINMLAFSFSNQLEEIAAGKKNLNNDRKFSELPGTAKELSRISSIISGEYFMGEQATEEKFKTEASKAKIIHLALHGLGDDKSFYKSRLIFKRSIDSSEDGNLYNYELLNLNLRAELAVLSSCESGVGKASAGEGVFSIARGFTSAGCPSVLMSIWNVNDASTANLMEKFYRLLANGTDLDISVRNAKLEYLSQSDGRLAHPVNWASFLLQGNTNSIINSNIRLYWFMIPVIVAFHLLSLFLLARFNAGNPRVIF
jgi:CHAT domain-containing protein